MNNPILSCVIAISMTLQCHSAMAASSELPSGLCPDSGNPILPGYYADPSVVTHDGRYYLYATLDPWGGETLGCWSSEDFANWEFHELNWPTKAACTSPTSKDAMVWAPSVVQGIDGAFYMYVSVGSEIWVGFANHPLGPWQNLLGDQPMIPEDFRPGYHMIDGEAFIDDDGQPWLYWGSGWNWTNGKCWVVPLEADMVTFAGEVVDVTPPHFFEAPLMVKRDGRYYLMYSDGKTIEDTYQVHYAVGDSPTGPFVEAPNSPILVSDHSQNILSPGHHTVVELEGEHYILYHRHSIPFDPEVVGRQVCMEPLEWDEHGWIRNIRPSHDGVERFARLRTSSAPEMRGQVKASSVQHSWTGADQAQDNNYATLWKPDPEDSRPTLVMDLGKRMQVTHQELRLEFAWKPYHFTVQHSDDGSTWELLEDFSLTPAKGSPVQISTPVEARHLRLVFAPDSETRPGVMEWQVF